MNLTASTTVSFKPSTRSLDEKESRLEDLELALLRTQSQAPRLSSKSQPPAHVRGDHLGGLGKDGPCPASFCVCIAYGVYVRMSLVYGAGDVIAGFVASDPAGGGIWVSSR